MITGKHRWDGRRKRGVPSVTERLRERKSPPIGESIDLLHKGRQLGGLPLPVTPHEDDAFQSALREVLREVDHKPSPPKVTLWQRVKGWFKRVFTN